MADENILTLATDESEDPNQPNKQTNSQNKNYAVKKRVPLKPLEGKNVIFVSRKTPFKAQLEKCTDLLAKGEKEIILHGLGVAIQRCCNLAVQLQAAFSGTHDIEINTGTLDVVDDLIPKTEDLEYDTQFDTNHQFTFAYSGPP